jgi:hypothetical protein
MSPRSAKTRFLKRLAAAGQSVDALTPAAGSEALLAFYAEERADGCDPDDDGDMLLFEWGVNDWGDGPAFEITLTRQLVAADGEEPRQLALTFRFDPAAVPNGLKSGSKWCESPDGLAAFRRFVAGSRAVRAVGSRSPTGVTLRFGRT